MNKEVQLPPFVVNEINPVLPLSQTPDWGHDFLRIPEIHKIGLTGKNVRIAVIDTACDTAHPDLINSIENIHNLTAEPYKATNNHSTGVCGVIGARNNATGVLGVAPDCKLIPIKALDESGSGSLDTIIKAIDLAISLNVDIINMSLGATGTTNALKQAIARAFAKGIYIVCAAGNSGLDNDVNYPARYAETYGVAAINQSGKISAFSSRGWEVDIAAPGERILTTWKNNSYAKVSGTSFAAPYVAGLFALFLEAKIKVTHDLLKKTSIDIEELGPDTKSGYGLINPVLVVTPPPPPPVCLDESDLEKVKQAHRLLSEILKLT